MIKYTRPISLLYSAALCALLVSPAPAAELTEPVDRGTPSPAQTSAVYGQLTNITQRHASFTAPYSGTNSMAASGRTEETTDITLFAGLRLGAQTELWINPEIDQGFGISNTLGAAGYPSGGAYKLGANAPYVRLPRLFVRHVIGLSENSEAVVAAANQLAGSRSVDNLTLTIGKFAVVDIFDANSYAHDPRTDFLNWSIIEAGAFDYAADVWGYTNGAVAEWNRGERTLRGGVFQLSPEPNSKITSVKTSQYSLVVEAEQRLDWNSHPGKVKLLAFMNRANMSSYQAALAAAALNGGPPDVSTTRRFGSNTGWSLNAEQELAADVGVFARFSMNRGVQEAYEFTDINRSLSFGAAIKGDRWGRHDDTIGVATAINALSADAKAYFAAGGLGVLIGDGRLNYGNETVLEAYYSLKLHRQLALSFDIQRISNPAYNRDRGPVSTYALRLHGEF
ncbi:MULTISPECIES: carbohydrate porin [unclassified Undibacterium]|uniref:carbohydrate porin n=1 Tax=unclassified Undibacterium TaxID=2630295 RepID=UPI002AC93AE5|nr:MULTISPECIES: carbohydrate porin [unclassified Undibacterium]MEB0140596.1 carbohydrate porin [Undibacterium sp. CCC2.1]MEB0173650.1 carbohydrate porin [Undibacterium sp. CCC1.1]MEB0177362.1 carbohydrate porin [Undibacterium sp. CCC3.4]MEB0216774.1 carbohydrate porin [Undibacterium sp. 5I2]WPX44548.1 carbohydrate porin [Undibacterium sp. CCC3.4]